MTSTCGEDMKPSSLYIYAYHYNRTFMRNTSFSLVLRATIWVTRSTPTSLDWDLAASIFKLEKQRFVVKVHNCVSRNGITFVFYAGFYEG